MQPITQFPFVQRKSTRNFTASKNIIRFSATDWNGNNEQNQNKMHLLFEYDMFARVFESNTFFPNSYREKFTGKKK